MNEKDMIKGKEMVDREIVTTRLIHAPREFIFEFWTKPEHIKNWWGPNGFTNTIYKMDVTPGGQWEFVMHGPDGIDYPNRNVFIEIVKPELIVFQHMDATHKFVATVSFEAIGSKTRLTFRMLFESAAEYERVKILIADANEQNFDRLEAYMNINLN